MLRPCPECEESVSDTAERCPRCGYRILGRAGLLPCPHCGADVIPEVHPHDTISRYCPLCKKPVTNRAGRRIFFVLSGLAFAVIAAAILYAYRAVSGRVLP